MLTWPAFLLQEAVGSAAKVCAVVEAVASDTSAMVTRAVLAVTQTGALATTLSLVLVGPHMVLCWDLWPSCYCISTFSHAAAIAGDTANMLLLHVSAPESLDIVWLDQGSL